ncbi:hypothetical protein ABT261_16120, partial [Amycolatopsis sp. NPDC000740]
MGTVIATSATRTHAAPCPCPVPGCAWRGICPDHDPRAETEPDADLNRLMRMRPFGAGRKRQRAAARYETRYLVKSAVSVTSIAERRENPVAPVRQGSRIVHPDPFAYLHDRYSNRPQAGRPTTTGTDEETETRPADPAAGEPTSPPPVPVADEADPAETTAPTPATLASLLRAKSTPPVPAAATASQSAAGDALPA